MGKEWKINNWFMKLLFVLGSTGGLILAYLFIQQIVYLFLV